MTRRETLIKTLMRLTILAIPAAALAQGAPVPADLIEDGVWSVTVKSQSLGVATTEMRLTEDAGGVSGGSSPADGALVRKVAAGDQRPKQQWNPAGGALTLKLTKGADGEMSGTMTTPFGTLPIKLHAVSPRRIEGSYGSGTPIAATYQAVARTAPLRDYPAIAAALLKTARERVYDPRLLNSDGWRRFETSLGEIASQAHDDAGFFYAIRAALGDAPVSHIRVWRPQMSNAEFFAQFEAQAAAHPAARFQMAEDGVAVITIDHFVGDKVSDQIDDAFTAALKSGARSLVIDLRQNSGGAMAALETLAWLLDRPFDYGYFLGAPWWRDHAAPPSPAQRLAIKPFTDPSVAEFQNAVRTQPMVVLRLDAVRTHFTGRVAVLVSHDTQSAAELVAEVLKRSGRAVLIGQTTEGELLASDFFDLPDGYKVQLPSADYYTADGQRVEGHGVEPDIAVAQGEDAMQAAIKHLASAP